MGAVLKMGKEIEQKKVREVEFKSFNQDVARDELSRKVEAEEEGRDEQ